MLLCTRFVVRGGGERCTLYTDRSACPHVDVIFDSISVAAPLASTASSALTRSSPLKVDPSVPLPQAPRPRSSCHGVTLPLATRACPMPMTMVLYPFGSALRTDTSKPSAHALWTAPSIKCLRARPLLVPLPPLSAPGCGECPSKGSPQRLARVPAVGLNEGSVASWPAGGPGCWPRSCKLPRTAQRGCLAGDRAALARVKAPGHTIPARGTPCDLRLRSRDYGDKVHS